MRYMAAPVYDGDYKRRQQFLIVVDWIAGLAMRDYVERRFAPRAATLTLTIEALRERAHLERLLARISHYGERVSIAIDENLHTLVAIDSSVFHVVLEP